MIDETTEFLALSLFRSLLKIDTTNPPGNEKLAAECVAEFLADGGLIPEIYDTGKHRANVVARLKGNGDEAPLALVAHLDVVPAGDNSDWDKPPFAAEVKDGWLYGRGAVDMKNMVAMSATVMRQLKQEQVPLKRDVIFVAVADEEMGCDYGSHWLVDHQPEAIRAEYMLGEVGGFSLYIDGATFYPIQVAEKGIAWLEAVVRGEGGHGSLPRADSAVIRLAQAIAKIGRTRLPQHCGPVVTSFVKTLAGELGIPKRWLFPLLLRPNVSSVMLKLLPKTMARGFAAQLSNTASPTVFRGGGSTNVIPRQATVEIDGRTLPGQTAADLIAELRAIVGHEVEFNVMREAPPVEAPVDTLVFAKLCEALKKGDPAGIPVPYLMPGFTDAKAFSRLGTKCYGFAPLKLPETTPVKFFELYHNSNERIPLTGFFWGLRVLEDAVRSICAVP